MYPPVAVYNNPPLSFNIGEQIDDTEIDLVNSLCVRPESLNYGFRGWLLFSLLAHDRSEVVSRPPPHNKKFIGVWEGNFIDYTYGPTIELEIRYDHVAARNHTPIFLLWNPGADKWEKYDTQQLSGNRVKVEGLPQQNGSKIIFALVVPDKDGTLMILK